MKLFPGVWAGMAEQPMDLVVIGAGASGASVAYEAAQRGLSVALLEAGDIGGGTSCRSTKLLHGGVRYLELAFKTLDLAQLNLVREALLERGHWLRQAPFLAQRLELALPTESFFGQAYYRLGLGVYDTLSGREGIGSSRLLSRRALEQALPQLKPCHGAVAYSDGQFNDARLNLLLALTAEQAGVVLRSRCPVVDLEKDANGRLCAAISENADGVRERWPARVIINATGIGADSIRQQADSSVDPRMLTSRGTHIVLQESLCPEGVGLLVPSTDDGRVLFMLPFFGRTLVGTTDQACSQEAATRASDQEETYLLDYVKRWFPAAASATVTSRWAGGRPLLKPAGEGLDSSRVVREHEVETLPCGLVSVMGGKWTTCRPMALDTLEAVERQLQQPLPKARPLPLIGAAADHTATLSGLEQQRMELEAKLPDTPLRDLQLDHLQANHGLQALPLIETSAPDDREPLSAVIPVCRAEFIHAVKREHARSSDDVLERRCRLAMVDEHDARRLRPEVEDVLAQAALSG